MGALGDALEKWAIVKMRDTGSWHILPPITRGSLLTNSQLGGVYPSGAEALAAFNRGAK